MPPMAGTVVVFVEDDNVPVDHVNPLVFHLDTSGLVLAQIVLERAETDDGARVVCLFVRQFRGARDKLPTLEVHMCLQVFLPSTLYGGLEGQHEDALPLHLPGQLIGGEGLAEAHLAVPKIVRFLPVSRL